MADKSPYSDVYHENEVIKDPEADNAVQIPVDGLADGTAVKENVAHYAELETPNEQSGDKPAEMKSEPEVPASDGPPKEEKSSSKSSGKSDSSSKS